MIRSHSTRSAGSTVSTRNTLNSAPLPIRWPRSPIAAVVDIKWIIYPAKMIMVPDVNTEGQDSLIALIQASFFPMLFRQDT